MRSHRHHSSGRCARARGAAHARRAAGRRRARVDIHDAHAVPRQGCAAGESTFQPDVAVALDAGAGGGEGGAFCARARAAGGLRQPRAAVARGRPPRAVVAPAVVPTPGGGAARGGGQAVGIVKGEGGGARGVVWGGAGGCDRCTTTTIPAGPPQPRPRLGRPHRAGSPRGRRRPVGGVAVVVRVVVCAEEAAHGVNVALSIATAAACTPSGRQSRGQPHGAIPVGRVGGHRAQGGAGGVDAAAHGGAGGRVWRGSGRQGARFRRLGRVVGQGGASVDCVVATAAVASRGGPRRGGREVHEVEPPKRARAWRAPCAGPAAGPAPPVAAGCSGGFQGSGQGGGVGVWWSVGGGGELGAHGAHLDFWFSRVSQPLLLSPTLSPLAGVAPSASRGLLCVGGRGWANVSACRRPTGSALELKKTSRGARARIRTPARDPVVHANPLQHSPHDQIKSPLLRGPPTAVLAP